MAWDGGGGVTQLDTSTWGVPAAVTLPLAMSNWFSLLCSTTDCRTEEALVMSQHLWKNLTVPCWTANQRAVKQLQLHLNLYMEKPQFGATVLGKEWKQTKHWPSYREKDKPQNIQTWNYSYPCPPLGWENCKRNRQLPAVPPCPCRVLPCNLAIPFSHEGELVSENGKDGLDHDKSQFNFSVDLATS